MHLQSRGSFQYHVHLMLHDDLSTIAIVVCALQTRWSGCIWLVWSYLPTVSGCAIQYNRGCGLRYTGFLVLVSTSAAPAAAAARTCLGSGAAS